MELVKEILRGNDDGVLYYLYKNCLPMIKSMVSKLGGTVEDAKDVFQDGVVILYRKIRSGEFEQYANPDAFLYTICRNLWLNRMKRDSKMAYPEKLPEKMDDQADIQRNWEMREKEEAIVAVFARLGERCSQLLKLVYIRQLKAEEIALELNMASTDVVKTTKNRCKNKLQDLLQEHPHLAKVLSNRS